MILSLKMPKNKILNFPDLTKKERLKNPRLAVFLKGDTSTEIFRLRSKRIELESSLRSSFLIWEGKHLKVQKYLLAKN